MRIANKRERLREKLITVLRNKIRKIVVGVTYDHDRRDYHGFQKS